MFGMSIQELVLIFIVVLVVLGPKRLPQLATALGRAIREFRRASWEIRQSLEIDELRKDFRDAVQPPEGIPTSRSEFEGTVKKSVKDYLNLEKDLPATRHELDSAVNKSVKDYLGVEDDLPTTLGLKENTDSEEGEDQDETTAAEPRPQLEQESTRRVGAGSGREDRTDEAAGSDEGDAGGADEGDAGKEADADEAARLRTYLEEVTPPADAPGTSTLASVSTPVEDTSWWTRPATDAWYPDIGRGVLAACALPARSTNGSHQSRHLKAAAGISVYVRKVGLAGRIPTSQKS